MGFRTRLENDSGGSPAEGDLEYMELQRKVEEINKAAEADTIRQSSGRIKRLFQLISRPSTALSDGKKRRFSTSSQSLNLSTDGDDIMNKISSIIKQINNIESKMKDEIKLEEWFDKISLNGVYDPREQQQFTQNKRVTTSSTNERELYGRDYEFRQLIKLVLREPNANDNISVVPIVGMGGIGKTTLAQFVFNSTEIANHFDKKAWICVSDHFDKFRITKEILDSFSIVDSNSPTDLCGITTSLDLLERELKRHLKGKKFLLVLDDVWSEEWQKVLILLEFAQTEAIKLIVTCRDPKILGVLADGGNQITLKGLSDGDYWLFFLNCAFGGKNPDNYSQQLHDLGKKIVGKLKGSPLAAKTVGKILGRSLTEKHWKDILESDFWKLETDAHDIMSALALSFYYLPQPLQLCFTFCSMFPKGYEYDMYNLIDMWIAHDYIQECESSSKTL
ncbi:disease resistance protein RGA2-like [Dioscorea cayenensis subsp. rotundata]|uniref:Disease resistance protein RGA2-like n=1 Tax=Dioscorea cayennensis subsp. rotundata TaxID=55577 RepID=A0AB40D0E7_DIOCR|nr:disease resistance protein RGA2-like [Dioscorea cayenensis subsp. rotundata]